MPNRRDFLIQAVAAGGVIASGAAANTTTSTASKPLRLLFLGGTGFIGPHHVRAAVARGHKVSVFNRGISQADLPEAVERLVGDRNGNLDAIRNRDWDAVIDLATYGPGWVRSLGEALRGRIGHYTFISAVAVYDDPASNETTSENSKLLVYQGGVDPYSVTTRTGDYGALKVLGEREAETQFPGTSLILRPGYIAGPGDHGGALTYLSVRAQKGGEMLVAGEPATPVQFIDVRDLADWAVRMVEKRASGIYNAVGPAGPATFGQLTNTAVHAASGSAKPAWVQPAWLAEQTGNSEMWGQVLFWHSLSSSGVMRMSNERALAAGLAIRAMRTTMEDVLRWYRTLPAEQQEMLVTGRKRKHDGGGFVAVTASWLQYLEREKEVLGAWHAQQRMESSQ